MYRYRFPPESRHTRDALWKELTRRVFQKYVSTSDTVMDIGAGYCEFINVIRCRTKIAVDTNPDTKSFAAKNVRVLSMNALSVPRRYDQTIDVVFMSNFLEHLPDKPAVVMVLSRAYRLLKNGGTLIILQPDIDLTGSAYWDFIDHSVALNGKSVIEALYVSGFTVGTYVRRFLPYTTKGKLPAWPGLIPVYFAIPPALRPFAGQSLFVARKNA